MDLNCALKETKISFVKSLGENFKCNAKYIFSLFLSPGHAKCVLQQRRELHSGGQAIRRGQYSRRVRTEGGTGNQENTDRGPPQQIYGSRSSKPLGAFEEAVGVHRNR